MRFWSKAKDGGPKSTVTGYWLIEIKKLFSIVLLRFDNGSRDEYHSHAFHSANWVITGGVSEQRLNPNTRLISFTNFRPSFVPVITTKSNMHKVISEGTTWVLSFRGPWSKTWREYNPHTKKFVTLQHGRVPQ